MMEFDMLGRDVYFRRNAGAVVHARVWDAKRFMAAEMERGAMDNDSRHRYVVTPATLAEYRAELRRT